MSASLVRKAKRKKCANKVLTSETQVLRNKPALKYFREILEPGSQMKNF